MARLLETIRNTILTSIHGRRVGLDKDDYLVGPKALAEQVEDISTTAATSASPYGITNVLTSGSSQTGRYTLQAPVPGVRKTFALQSTSTGTQQFELSGGAVILGGSLTTAGSTIFSLIRQNAVVNLVGISTAVWRIADIASSLVSSDSRGVLFSSST